MKLLQSNNDKAIIELSISDFYIIRSIMMELYHEVCINIDVREFEIIHDIKKEDVLEIQKEILDLYDQLD